MLKDAVPVGLVLNNGQTFFCKNKPSSTHNIPNTTQKPEKISIRRPPPSINFTGVDFEGLLFKKVNFEELL